MTVDPVERFAVLQQAGKRLREAINAQDWKSALDEARFAKAVCTQIEYAVEGKVSSFPK